MQSGQLIPAVEQTQAASTTWMYWLITTAGSSSISTATTAATDTFLRTLVNPTITGAAIIAGYATSLAFSATVSLVYYGGSIAASGVTGLWQRATQPAPTFQGNREGNLGFY